MPIRFQCPQCGGDGCDVCSDGVWELSECPAKFIDDRAVEALKFARFARDGSWPVSGGMLDQTQWFMDACRLIWSEQDIIEAEIVKHGQ